jgi:NitT/TauT family transport system permease protein
MTSRSALRGALGIIGAGAIAELVVRTGLVDASALPAPTVVLARAVGLLGDGEFLSAVGTTLQAWAGGLLLAVAIAVPAGFLLGSLPWLGIATRAVVELLRPIPSVALIPLAILAFPSVTQMKMSLIVYASTWPILINTLYALRDVDPLQKETLRSYGFGRLASLWWISLPSSAPFILTGIRVAASVALIVVISTELLSGGDNSLGVFLANTQSSGGHTDIMLAGAVWSGVLGLAINGGLVWLERRTLRWNTVRAEAAT